MRSLLCAHQYLARGLAVTFNSGNLEHTRPAAGGLARFPLRPRVLVAAAICIAIIYLGSVTGKWWPTSDSALYLSLGRSLSQGHGYVFNGAVHTIVAPGLPVILAALRWAFGDGHFAPNLLMALCGMAALAMAYWAIGQLADSRTALLVVICCAFSYTFYMGSHRILTDAPFTAVYWGIGCVCLKARTGRRWWILLAAILAILALAIRAPGVATLGPLAVGFLFDRQAGGRPWRARAAAGGILVAMGLTLGILCLLARSIVSDTPLYVTVAQRIWSDTGRRTILLIGQGILALPRAMAEMFTGQEGFVVFGAPALAGLVIGGVSLWRRGQRMPAITVALCVIGFAVKETGGAAIRPRYLMPVQPLMVYMTIEGILWVAQAACRWLKIKPNPSVYLTTVTIATVLVVSVNAPRLLRNVAYYTYLSHTPRFYDVIRDGKHANMYSLAERVHSLCPEDGLVLVPPDETSIIYYLAERRTLPLPLWPCRSAADADRIMRFILSTPGASMVVVNTQEAGNELQQALAASPRLSQAYQKGTWAVFVRGTARQEL